MRMPWEEDIDWGNTATTIVKGKPMIEMERAVNQILWYECMGDVDEYFENDTYIAKPYDWSEYDNNDWHFYHKPSGLKIQWYKYPLRGAMWNMELTHEQFLDVLYDCRSSRYKNITWDHDKWWERRADEGITE